jgi:hypothetical protein
MDRNQHDENTCSSESVAQTASNRRDGISGPQIIQMTMISDSLATMTGDYGKGDSTAEQRKSAIQQKREFPEIITETETIKGNA